MSAVDESEKRNTSVTRGREFPSRRKEKRKTRDTPPDTQLGGAFPLKRPGAPEGRGRFQACSGPGQGGHLKPEHEAATPDHRAPVKEI